MKAQRNAALLGLLAVALLAAPAAAEEPRTWVEVRSANLIVVSDAGERRAREIAEEFEKFRLAYRTVWPEAKLDSGKPLVLLATTEESSLRELLPEYWERKGRTQPSGIFVPSEERFYLAVQIGAHAGQPFHALYHEYMHLLNRLNYAALPAWLNEGLAEMYATARLVGRTAAFGALHTAHLQVLRSSDLLPLD